MDTSSSNTITAHEEAIKRYPNIAQITAYSSGGLSVIIKQFTGGKIVNLSELELIQEEMIASIAEYEGRDSLFLFFDWYFSSHYASSAL